MGFLGETKNGGFVESTFTAVGLSHVREERHLMRDPRDGRVGQST